MKKTLLALLGVLLILPAWTQKQTEIKEQPQLLVYYFHMTHRCKTCNLIESTTRKVLQDHFKSGLDKGEIVFRTFNAELPENKSISKKYDAYGATLALTGLKAGKENIVDMTNFAFSKINSEDAFEKGLIEKINEMLKH